MSTVSPHGGDAQQQKGNMGRAFAIATGLAFLLRLPFAIAPGFGLDFDAWLLASSARRLAEEGIWHPSRFPGYPLVEIVFAGLWPLGSRALTIATSLAAACAAGFGAAWLAQHRPGERSNRCPWLLPVALTTLPCVALPAASALDMPWSLAAAAASTTALALGRTRSAAVLVGLAILARPASAVLLPALAWVTWRKDGARPAAAITLLASAVAAPLLFSPEPPPLKIGAEWPGLSHMAGVVWLGALGPVGAIAALAVVAFAAWSLARGAALDPVARYQGIAALLGLLLFVMLPYQANYLCVPLFMGGLALAPHLSRGPALATASMLMVGGLVVPTGSGFEAGPLRRDVWRREAQVAEITRRAREIAELPPSTVVEAREHAAALRYLLRGRGPEVRMEIPREARPDLERRGRAVVEF